MNSLTKWLKITNQFSSDDDDVKPTHLMLNGYKLFVKNDTYYVRPEKVKVVNKKSKYKVLVEKCFFQGKEYKIKGRREKETWHFFSSKPLKEQKGVYVEFGKEDLIYFDPVCKNFFK